MNTLTEDPFNDRPPAVQGPRTTMRDFNDHVIANERQACSVESCGVSRYGWSAFCRYHAKRNYENGDPVAKPLTWPNYRKERREIAAFLSVKANRHHAAILAVSEELRQRIALAEDKAGEYWQRLREVNAQPLDLIVVVAARMLHAQRHASFGSDPRSAVEQSRLIAVAGADSGDGRFVRTEIGKAVVKLFEVPKKQRPGGKQEESRMKIVRSLGGSVLAVAGDLCQSIAAAVEKERAILDEAKRNAKSARFTSPTTGEVLA